MKAIHELKAQRKALTDAMQAILDEAKKGESGSMTAEQRTKFDRFKSEIADIDNKIKLEEDMQAVLEGAAPTAKPIDSTQRSKDKAGKSGEQAEKRKIAGQYSLIKGIAAMAAGKPIDGLVAEMHREAEIEARDAGGNVVITGLGIPSWLGRGGNSEKRDLTAGTATTGQELVPTDHRDFIPILRPKLMTESLGIRVLTGLSGNIDMPKQTTTSTGNWEGETDPNAETTLGTGKVSLSPKRFSAFHDYSRQIMFQGSPDVEAMVRDDLSQMLAIEADRVVINGSGSGQPTGIIQNADVNVVAIGTNGGAPTWAHVVDCETQVSINNADMGTLAYLTTPGVRGKLKTTFLDSGSGQFVWEKNSSELNSYRAAVSTQVPSNLTKGSGTDLHAILYGDWSSYVFGQWGGFDILVDVFTQAGNAVVRVHANMFVDGNCRTGQSFSVIKDVDIS